jgi:hypothetical protein
MINFSNFVKNCNFQLTVSEIEIEGIVRVDENQNLISVEGACFTNAELIGNFDIFKMDGDLTINKAHIKLEDSNKIDAVIQKCIDELLPAIENI